MFEDLIEKLKASVEELRKKLPGGGGGDDDEYEDEDDYEEKYHDDDEDGDDGKTVKVQITDLLQKGEGSDDDEDSEEAGPKEKTKKIYTDGEDEDEDEEDEDADAAAQKRKKIIIYAVAALLIGFLLKDEFMPSEPEVVAVPVVKPKKRKRKKRKKPKKVVETAAPEKPAEAQAKKPEEAPAKPVVDVPPETAVGLPSETKPESTTAPVVEAPEVESTTAPVDKTPETEVAENKIAEEINKNPEEEKPAEDTGLDVQLGEETASEVKEKPVTDMASKIEKKLEYVAPPNYERSGRGLVYNCVGKHWACVDKFSYLTCKENTKWSGQNSKKPECVIKNVYASVEDCGIIQKHYIESSEATTFCGNIPGVEDKASSEEVSEEIDLLGE